MMQQPISRVEQLKLTSDQIKSAFKRASENAQHWPEWNDPCTLKTGEKDHFPQKPESECGKKP
jgi:hypothetical protein